MNRLPHMILGASCGLTLWHRPEVIGFAALGAVLPDLDLYWTNRHAQPPRPGAACGLLEHRGPTHSLAAALAVAFVPLVGLPLAVGWLSHLAADSVSYLGVPWLWPLCWRRLRLLPYGLRLRSGSSREWLIVACVVALSAAVEGWF